MQHHTALISFTAVILHDDNYQIFSFTYYTAYELLTTIRILQRKQERLFLLDEEILRIILLISKAYACRYQSVNIKQKYTRLKGTRIIILVSKAYEYGYESLNIKQKYSFLYRGRKLRAPN
jgi:hypothetical protein